MRLYKMVKLTEGTPVQYVGMYVARWQADWGLPQVGFVEADDTTEKMRAFIRTFDAWAEADEIFGPLFEALLEARNELPDAEVPDAETT